MAKSDFVKEMQENLRQQKRDHVAARKKFPDTWSLETSASKNWEILVAWVGERLAEINQGPVEPLLAYSKPTEDEFNITNKAADMSVTVKREANGNLVYEGSAASGIFRAQIAGNELTYSWERTRSTPTMRVTFGSMGVNVTLDEIGELIIRSVVTP